MIIDQAKVDALRELSTDPKFRLFLELLDDRISLHLGELVKTENRAEWRKGVVTGLQKARGLVNDTLQAHERTNAGIEREREAAERKSRQRNLATFGSVWRGVGS